MRTSFGEAIWPCIRIPCFRSATATSGARRRAPGRHRIAPVSEHLTQRAGTLPQREQRIDARVRNQPPGRTQRIRVPLRIGPPVRWRHPALVFVYGFAGFIAAGTLVLSLPAASAAGQWTPLLDALFTSTSAVCVTGLIVLDTGTYWSTFGQVAILILIQ